MSAPALLQQQPTLAPTIGGLPTRAILAGLHLSAWQGQRLDRKTTDEVLKERHATADAGRFEKYLVPKA